MFPYDVTFKIPDDKIEMFDPDEIPDWLFEDLCQLYDDGAFDEDLKVLAQIEE